MINFIEIVLEPLGMPAPQNLLTPPYLTSLYPYYYFFPDFKPRFEKKSRKTPTENMPPKTRNSDRAKCIYTILGISQFVNFQ